MIRNSAPEVSRGAGGFAALLLLVLAAMISSCSQNPTGYIDDPVVHAVNFDPAWSPDGVRIAYRHYAQSPEEQKDGYEQIWIGTITSAGEFVTRGVSPAWAPDGNSLVFIRDGDIWRRELDSGTETRLTSSGSCFTPACSPDGIHIAFRMQDHTPDAAGDSAGIWMIDVRTLQRRQLTVHVGSDPSWSQNGAQIAISAPLASSSLYDEIALIDTVMSVPRRLTFNAMSDQEPAWSPGGNTIAWYASGEGASPLSGIWLMNVDGTSQHLLIRTGGYPSWSPDGKFIVYGSFNNRTHVQSLWIAGSDGKGARELPY